MGLLLLIATAHVSSTANADNNETLDNFPIDALHVLVDRDDSEFTVIYSRMEETATAAVAFGLIGAAINSSINDGEDEERAERFAETAAAIDVSALIESEILARLESKEIPMASDEASASHVLKVEVKEWGLRKIAFHEDEMITFIRMRLTVRDGKKLVWEKWHKQSGKEEILFDDYTVEAFDTNMRKLAKRVGKRIANEIIYR